MATPNGTQLQIATDSGFTTKQVDYSGDYVTEYTVADNVLSRNTQLYARIRHSTVEAGYTPWSATRMFTIAQYNKWLLYPNQDTWSGGGTYLAYNPDEDCIYAVSSKNNTVTGISGTSISKYTVSGVLVWCKHTDGNKSTFYRITLNEAKTHIYIAGYLYSDNGTYCSMYIVKMDLNGNIVWQKTYVNTNHTSTDGDTCYGILETGGNLYICGYARTNSGNNYRYSYLMKLTSDGILVWMKSMPLTYGSFQQMKFSPDKNYIYAVGYYYRTSSTTIYHGTVAKFDLSGNIIWQKCVGYDIAYAASLRGVAISSDGSYIYTAGITLINSDGNGRPILVKWDSDGNKIWERILEYKDAYDLDVAVTDEFYGCDIDSSGNVYCTGVHRTANNSVFYGMFVKFNSDGTVLWNKRIIYSNSGYARDVICTSDNNIYAIGYYQVTSVYTTMTIVAIDANGPTIGNLPDLPSFSWANIYLNFVTFSSVVTDVSTILTDSTITLTDVNYTFYAYSDNIYKSSY